MNERFSTVPAGDERTREVFAIVRSFTPDVDMSPHVFPRKDIRDDAATRQLFAKRLRDGSVKLVVPRIYASPRIYMPFHTAPLAYSVASALALEHGWRVALPVEIARFILGKREKPNEPEVRTFLYDQAITREYKKCGFKFEPAADPSLFELTAMGQAIRLGRDQSDEDMGTVITTSRFAASAWFREGVLAEMLEKDLASGALRDFEPVLAFAIRKELTRP